MLLVMLVALDGRAEWLALSAGAFLANSAGLNAAGTLYVPYPRVVGYGGGLLIALAITLARYLRARRAAAAPTDAVPALPARTPVLTAS